MSTTTTTTGASAIRTTSLRKRREARAGIGFVAPFLAMFAVVFLIPKEVEERSDLRQFPEWGRKIIL